MTVTIGEQGSGKSPVAKLYSLFSWLEKALMRHSLTAQYIMRYSRFRKTYAAYNHLDSYFRPETKLRFKGFHYLFEYLGEQLHIMEINPEKTFFSISKVMYVPAERNILGSVDHPSQLKGLENRFLPVICRARCCLPLRGSGCRWHIRWSAGLLPRFCCHAGRK